MSTTIANHLRGDTLRDPRMQWQRAMHRFAADRAPADGASAAAAAAAAAPADAPTFAERLRRVEVPGAAEHGVRRQDESTSTFAEQMRRVPVSRAADGVAHAADDPRGAARAAAEKMVSTMFVQPLLDMALEQAGTGPFAPGQAEKTFRPLLNQRIADEIVRKADLPLVDAIVDRVMQDAPATGVDAETREPRDG